MGLTPIQSSHRATSFVNSFKRQGKIPAIVDYVAAGSRFKWGASFESLENDLLTIHFHRIFLPKDNQVLTLVLGGELASCPLERLGLTNDRVTVIRDPSSKDSSKCIGKG